jgi:tyrosyl-tRNA synthetase
VTDVQVADIEKMKRETHPMEAKKELARRIVTDFHSAEVAAKAAGDWTKQFQKDEVPEDIEVVTVEDHKMRLDKLLARVGLADSVSDAVRKVKQKAVKVNGEVVTEPATQLEMLKPITLQAGRKIKKVQAA